MKKLRLKVMTPHGTFYSADMEVADDVGTNEGEEFYQEICKGGTHFQMELADGSTMHMPKDMIQQSLFFIEVRVKGEDEV